MLGGFHQKAGLAREKSGNLQYISDLGRAFDFADLMDIGE